MWQFLIWLTRKRAIGSSASAADYLCAIFALSIRNYSALKLGRVRTPDTIIPSKCMRNLNPAQYLVGGLGTGEGWKIADLLFPPPLVFAYAICLISYCRISCCSREISAA